MVWDTAPGKEALTMDTEESATVPSATDQVQVDMEASLAPWVMVTEELGTEVSIAPWVTFTKDLSSLQDTVMEVSVTPVLVGVPVLGEVLEPRCK